VNKHILLHASRLQSLLVCLAGCCSASRGFVSLPSSGSAQTITAACGLTQHKSLWTLINHIKQVLDDGTGQYSTSGCSSRAREAEAGHAGVAFLLLLCYNDKAFCVQPAVDCLFVTVLTWAVQIMHDCTWQPFCVSGLHARHWAGAMPHKLSMQGKSITFPYITNHKHHDQVHTLVQLHCSSETA